MASTFSPNLNLELQGTGDNPGTWGGVLNTAALSVIDQSLGRIQGLSLSSVDVTVSTSQSQSNGFTLTGVLTANVSVIFPSIGRTYFVANNTTGAFTVTLKTASAGATVTIPQGDNGFYIINGTDVIAPTNLGVPSGSIQMMAMTSVPIGWLVCDGTAVSRTVYARLFATIGITFGIGDGTTTFNLPDARGYFFRGWDNGRGIDPARVFGSSQSFAVGPHTHTGTTGDDSPAHTHQYLAPGGPGAAVSVTPGATPSATFIQTDPPTQKHQHPFTTNSNGGTESRPYNIAIQYCIKT